MPGLLSSHHFWMYIRCQLNYFWGGVFSFGICRYIFQMQKVLPTAMLDKIIICCVKYKFSYSIYKGGCWPICLINLGSTSLETYNVSLTIQNFYKICKQFFFIYSILCTAVVGISRAACRIISYIGML